MITRALNRAQSYAGGMRRPGRRAGGEIHYYRKTMDRSVTGLLGGALKPNDPRRFLIEAMIGAMNADGVVDPRETAAVEQQIASHPLFQGLGAGAARTLIDLSNDAIRFAGNALGRAPAIAKRARTL